MPPLQKVKITEVIDLLLSLCSLLFGVSLAYVPPYILFGGTIRNNFEQWLYNGYNIYGLIMVGIASIIMIALQMPQFKKYDRISLRIFPILFHYVFITIRLVWYWETSSLLFYASLTITLILLTRRTELAGLT